jgi:hypothetical protein
MNIIRQNWRIHTHRQRNVHHTNKTDTSKEKDACFFFLLQLVFFGRLVEHELPFVLFSPRMFNEQYINKNLSEEK